MDLDSKVCKLYKENNIYDLCDLSITNVSEKLGVTTKFYDEKSEAIIFEGKKYIFLNEHTSVEDKWFQFCHELGHLQLHVGNQMQFCGTKQDCFISYQEVKANHFALYACAPSHILNDYRVYEMNYDRAERFVKQECHMNDYYAKRRIDEYIRVHNSIRGNVI